MVSKFSRLALSAALVLGGTCAQADPFAGTSPVGGTLVWQGKAIAGGYAADQHISVSVPQIGGTAGLFTGSFNPTGDDANTDDTFTFFCIDLFEYVPSNGTPNTSYTRYTVTPGAGSSDDDQRLRNLFAMNAWPTTAIESAAMQLAIWNIIYDVDAFVDADGIPGSGGFAATGDGGSAANATIGLANDMMDDALNPGAIIGTHTLFKFVSEDVYDDNHRLIVDGNQDFIAYRYTPPLGGDPRSVPLPGTLALLGAGLAGLGFARRKPQR